MREPPSAWNPEEPSRLPRTRGECAGGARPCPLVSCRYHLYLDVTTTGELTVNFPETHDLGRKKTVTNIDELPDVAETLRLMPATCALDVADAGEHLPADVALCLGVSREGARQIELKAYRAFRRLPSARELAGK